MMTPAKKPRGHLKGKIFEKGQAVRIHRDPPPKMKYITKWRNPYEEKGDIVEVVSGNHYRVRSRKTGKVTREHAQRLAPCTFVSHR